MWQTLITAHSGADGTEDNSLASVRDVLGTEADAFEVDVRRRDDGAPVLGHDRVAQDALTLATVLELMAEHPTMRINCDLKEAGLEHDVVSLAVHYGLTDRLMLSGYTSPERWPETAYVTMTNGEHLIDFDQVAKGKGVAEQMAQALRVYPVRVLNLHHRWFEGLQALPELPPLSLWTVDDPERLRLLLRAGVYNLTTRNLRVALALRKELQA